MQGVFRPLHLGVQEHYSKVRNAAKRMQPICKICVPHFDKKCATLLWFASGFVRQARNMVLQRFLPNVAKCATFSRGKYRNPWNFLNCVTLQDGTLSGSLAHAEG